MKKILIVFLVALLFASCKDPVSTIITETQTLAEQYADDPRLSSVSAKSAVWIAYPRQGTRSHEESPESAGRGMNTNPEVIALCCMPGWSYIFYDDEAVIGYEPFPDNIAVTQDAARITVESHNNLAEPGEEWGVIIVSVPVIPPDTSHDPDLGKWQMCFCLDDGTIVMGPLTAEFDFEWIAWKSSVAALTLEMYNRDNDPDAHIVWGNDE